MDKEPFDVFLWANEVDEIKGNVSVELFLFNKNYTPFKIRYSEALTGAVKAMFMGEAISYIIKEADKGLECREYEKARESGASGDAFESHRDGLCEY